MSTPGNVWKEVSFSCQQECGSLFALMMKSDLPIGCGGLKRSSFTGGLAKGTPRKVSTFLFNTVLRVPSIFPTGVSLVTDSSLPLML